MEDQTAMPEILLHGQLSKHRAKWKVDFFNRAEDYFLIFAITDKILSDFYTKTKGEDSFLDLWEFADFLGFQIKYENLNLGRYAKLGLILGRLQINPELGERVIFLEFEENITEQQERFAIAYLLGCYYMQENLGKRFIIECVDVRIPQSSVEFNAYIFAAFLLFPPVQFFKAIAEYINARQRPIHQEALLLEMSKWAKVPYHFAINSYEYLRVFAGLYYNLAFRERMKSSLKKLGFEQKEVESIYKQIWNKEKFLIDEFFY